MVQSFYIAFENSDEWEHSEDWGVLCSRYRFPDATIKENKVNVVGSNGVIDLSSELTGDVVFNNVQGEIGFIILRDSNFDYLHFKNKYHGKRVKIMPDNDIEHYRVGRLSIKEDNNQDVLKRVSMLLDADPFRYSVTEKVETHKVNIAEVSTFTHVGNADDDFSYVDNDTNIFGEHGVAYSCVNSTSQNNFYVAALNINAETLQVGEEKLTISLLPNTEYYISASIRFALPAFSSEKDVSTDFRFWDTEAPLFFGFKFENGDVVYQFKNDFAAHEIKTARFAFFSAEHTELNLICYGFLKRKANQVHNQLETLVIGNLKIAKTPSFVTLENNGRKQVVPSLTSNVDCEVVINSNSTHLTANQTKRNFDLVVNGEKNNAIFIGDEEGEVTITYREAYL